MAVKDTIGRYGEEVAVRHLRDAGLVVLDRNWRCELGELDIVAREGDVLVICEVKTRSSEEFGSPLEAVGPVKLRRLRRLAARWLLEHAASPTAVRLDVVAVLRPRRGPTRLEHVRGVG